jgi:hypothetical protein
MAFFGMIFLTIVFFNTTSTNLDEYPLVDQTIFQQLQRIQNPSSCSGRFLLFNVSQYHCGFGCQFHQIVAHLITALETNRTLVLIDSRLNKASKYINSITGINCVFDSNQTRSPYNIIHDRVAFTNTEYQGIELKKYSQEIMNKKTKELHRPLAWYVAQFVGYVLQYNEPFKKRAQEFKQQIGFKSSCVGIHVRQTDKVEETYLLTVKDYMKAAEKYYDRYPDKAKCVYVITDEITILKNIRAQ